MITLNYLFEIIEDTYGNLDDLCVEEQEILEVSREIRKEYDAITKLQTQSDVAANNADG